MKQSHTCARNGNSGMTLLELTVVIVVLLSLISIIFIGARAWKRGADRSANILNIRNIQQAVRSHANLYQLDAGSSPLTSDILFDSGTGQGYLKEPKPPASTGATSYTYLTIVPEHGTLYVSNVAAIGAFYAPEPGSYSDW